MGRKESLESRLSLLYNKKRTLECLFYELEYLKYMIPSGEYATDGDYDGNGLFRYVPSGEEKKAQLLYGKYYITDEPYQMSNSEIKKMLKSLNKTYADIATCDTKISRINKTRLLKK